MYDIVRDLQDMRYLEWARIRQSSGTAGSFLKSYETENGRRIYYKLSDYDSVNGIVGHECVNEIIVCRLLDILGISHLRYRLIHAIVCVDSREYETWLCASEDYKAYGESKLAFEDYYQMMRQKDETPLDFCLRMDWGQYIYEMFLTDYLILNRDRHGANIEVLRDPGKRTIRLAPLFDHGLSFVCRCRTEEELSRFDVMKDIKVQSITGSTSAEDNLRLIPKGSLSDLGRITDVSGDMIFEGLEDTLPPLYFEVIWSMIQRRWQHYEAVCDT